MQIELGTDCQHVGLELVFQTCSVTLASVTRQQPETTPLNVDTRCATLAAVTRQPTCDSSQQPTHSGQLSAASSTLDLDISSSLECWTGP